MTSDESFMKQAVKQAKKAYDKLETPIGCVIVHEPNDKYEDTVIRIAQKMCFEKPFSVFYIQFFNFL